MSVSFHFKFFPLCLHAVVYQMERRLGIQRRSGAGERIGGLAVVMGWAVRHGDMVKALDGGRLIVLNLFQV